MKPLHYLAACGLLLLGAMIYVFAPVLRHKVEASVVVPQPVPVANQPAAVTPPATPEPTKPKPKPDKIEVSVSAPLPPGAERNPDGTIAIPRGGDPAKDDTPPQSDFHGFRLLPGERVTVRDVNFATMDVRAEYPIAVYMGGCYNTYTVQWHCSGNAADVFIVDQRRPPVFATPKANPVSVTFH